MIAKRSGSKRAHRVHDGKNPVHITLVDSINQAFGLTESDIPPSFLERDDRRAASEQHEKFTRAKCSFFHVCEVLVGKLDIAVRD